MCRIISITGLIVTDSAGELSFGGCPTIWSRMQRDAEMWPPDVICVAAVRVELWLQYEYIALLCNVFHITLIIYDVGGCSDSNIRLHLSCVVAGDSAI